MDLILLCARLVLAAVFVVAGVGKLADLPGSRKAAADFGVPTRLAPTFGLLLPIAEIAVAVALIPTATAWWGALGALALLLLFIAGIGYNLARGRQPDCHCFGQIHSAPAGWATIARNGTLALIAVVILALGWDDPGASAVAWLADLSGIEVVLVAGALLILAVLTALGWVVVNLIGQNGRLLLRLDEIEQALAAGTTGGNASSLPAAPAASAPAARKGLPVGSPAPAFALPDLDGTIVTLETLLGAGAPVLLVFADPNCGPCQRVMREVSRWRDAFADRLTIAVLSRGTMDENLVKAREHGLETVLIQPDRTVATAYGMLATPAAVLVRADGTIGAPSAAGYDAVRSLVDTIASEAKLPTHAAPTIRERVAMSSSDAPEFQLPDLSGKQVALSDLRARRLPVVLLFTDPQCAPCDALLPDLGRWQRDYGDRVTIALISRGTVAANQAKHGSHDLSHVLLQRDRELIEAYGITQAPAAVVVLPDGSREAAPAYGDLGIRLLLARVADAPDLRPAPVIVETDAASRAVRPVGFGEAVPSLELRTIDGELADLADVRGAETVLLFWNPGCGYCRQIEPEVTAWERERSTGSPRLIIVSTGTAEATRAHGFQSSVVLDPGIGVGRRFGSHGTPAAIRIDADGLVASPVASGAKAVLGLIRAGGRAAVAAPAGGERATAENGALAGNRESAALPAS